MAPLQIAGIADNGQVKHGLCAHEGRNNRQSLATPEGVAP